MVQDVPGEEDDPESLDVAENAERLSANAEVHKSAWQGTIEDMQALAAERREAGWDVLEIIAPDTAPMGRGSDDDESEFGLSYVVPDDRADDLTAALDAGEFPRYEVYRAAADGRVFVVTELLDPEREQAILVAGNFWRNDARQLVRTAREEGEMYTHLRTLDTTLLGSIRHDEYEQFFPEADRIAENPYGKDAGTGDGDWETGGEDAADGA